MHVVWLLAICGISVTSQSENGFQYINTDAFSLKDTCEMCYGYDCTSINEARCEYYKEANEILEKDDEYEKEKNEITNEVDNILGDYIDIASSTPKYKECVPLISQYTNCNKDNICNGCKVCNCDISGMWSCTDYEKCQSEPLLVMDHRALVLAMENLNEFEKFHLDRPEKSFNIMNNGININTSEDIVKWVYGVKNLVLDGRNTTETAALRNNTDGTSGLGYVYDDNTLLDFFENQNLNPKRLETRNAILVTNDSYINVNATIDNHTTKYQDLHNTVLFPLHNIVNEREKELNKLISIKENLLSYLKSHTNITFENITTASKNVENSSLYLYQFDVLPAIDFRRSNPNRLEDYLKKLKRDIYEVMRDIAKIQRLSNSSKMPQDLKILIRAMRNYVNKEKKRKKMKQSEIIINLRRKLDKDIDDEDEYPINAINSILEVLDKDMPTADALAPLSQSTRKILKRIVKHFAVEDHTSIISNIFDPENNVEHYLNNVGVKWQNMTLGIGRNEISERLYSLRLFKLALSKDITTIQKTIEIIEFAQMRRMNVIDHFVGERITSKIGNDLRKINNRVKQILQFQTIEKKDVISSTGQALTSTDINKTKIKSFLQRIRRLMKNSKKDIKDLLHKVKKSNIMKRIAKNKMDEMTYKKFSKHEETMRRWKENLNVVTRRKRHDGYFQNFVNRMKNIIPSYLRGKVKPAVKKKINKSESLQNKHHNKGKKIKKNITSTTPVIKLSTKRKHKGKRRHNHNKNVQQSKNTTQV